MLVSVIVPNYNHAEYLKQRIDTILEQSYQNFEVIILDDCSTDNSRDIIEQYRNHNKISKIIYNETNSGSTFSQWNRGIRLSKGELIWIAESDDFAATNLLQELQSEFDIDPQLGIAYCQSYMVNEKNEVTGSWQFWTNEFDTELFKTRFKIIGKDYIDKFLIYKNTIPNASAVLFRKKIYELIGGADESVSEAGDWLTWIKILTISNIAYIPAHLNNFRYHNKSVIAKAAKKASEKYIGKEGIITRINMHRFFKDKFSDDKDFKIIIKKNSNLLLEQYANESYFYVNKKRWIKGVSIIIKAGFSSINNFIFLLKFLLNKIFDKTNALKR